MSVCFLLCSFSAQANLDRLEIGVLAKRGAAVAEKEWAQLALYLKREIPQFNFSIVPLSFEEIAPAIKSGKIDFLLTNSGMYSDLSFTYRLSSLATLKRKVLGGSIVDFGSVVFVRADRADIHKYEDLKSRDIAAVSESSFGGWVAAYREMDSVGLSVKSFSKLEFLGTHDAVVFAVRDKRVDAGVVRTDTLEMLAAENKIRLEDYNVLPIPASARLEKETSYPLLLSSRLYPEWPFAKLSHVPDAIAERVVLALLSMPPESEAATSAGIMGWTIPQNYREVDRAYSQLGLGAYKDLVNYSLIDVISKYWRYVLSAFFSIFLLLAIALYIHSLNKSLHEVQGELKKLANTDGLTGLPNRSFFMAMAEKYMQKAKREKRKAAIMFLDLDRFKPINDTYGHDVGDELLIEISQRIKRALRDSDIVARIGGDEFLVMLWDVGSVESIELVINKLIRVASAPVVTGQGEQITVGCSAGVSIYAGGNESLEKLIKSADLALYEVKEKGRGFFIIHQG